MIIFSYCSLRVPVWYCVGKHLKQWLGASQCCYPPKKGGIFPLGKEWVLEYRNQRQKKSVRIQEEKALLDLLEVNALKENNYMFFFQYFFKTGKRLNTLLLISLSVKMNSWKYLFFGLILKLIWSCRNPEFHHKILKPFLTVSRCLTIRKPLQNLARITSR